MSVMIRLEDIEAREKAATAGEWSVSETTDDGFCILGVAYLMGANAEANADFIAASKRDIPYLLAELRETREKLEAVEKAAMSHGYSQAKAFMDAIDRILKGGD